jgi:TPR repeat protein
MGKTDDKKVEELMKRVEANDANAIYALGTYYYHGQLGLSQDQKKSKELLMRAAELGSSHAHCLLANFTRKGEIQRRRSSTMRLQLWQEMMWQDSTLEPWR